MDVILRENKLAFQKLTIGPKMEVTISGQLKKFGKHNKPKIPKKILKEAFCTHKYFKKQVIAKLFIQEVPTTNYGKCHKKDRYYSWKNQIREN